MTYASSLSRPEQLQLARSLMGKKLKTTSLIGTSFEFIISGIRDLNSSLSHRPVKVGIMWRDWGTTNAFIGGVVYLQDYDYEVTDA